MRHSNPLNDTPNRIQTFIVVPARSGSKGIANKNVKPLAGSPLLSWTASAISEANLPHSLAILSTDSANYAELGEEHGLPAPFLRPSAFANDSASGLQVIEHALAWFHTEYGYRPERIMCLQPTSPLRSPAIISQASDLMSAQQVDAVIGCKEIHRDLTTLFRRDDGFLVPLDKQSPTQTSRQQSKPLLTPNGAMYLCKTDYLLTHRSFYPPKTVALVMNAIESLDIDTDEDWAMAEAFIKQGLTWKTY